MDKKSGWKITMNGIEPVLETYTIKDNQSTYHKRYMFWPIRRIKKWFYNRKVKKHFKEIHLNPIECEGCGEGISEWAIKDPNNPKVDMFVCNHCVGYYDVYSTKRRLESQHMLENLENIRGMNNEYISWNRPRIKRRDSSNKRE